MCFFKIRFSSRSLSLSNLSLVLQLNLSQVQKWAVSLACQTPSLNSQEMQFLLKRHPDKDSVKKLLCKNLETAKCILKLKVETRAASLQLLLS